MNPKEFHKTFGGNELMMGRFLFDRPIEISLKDCEALSTMAKGDTLCIDMLKMGSKDGFLLWHELGHLVEATPEELFKPNLGIWPGSPDSGTPREEIEFRYFQESRVLAWHLNLLEASPGKVEKLTQWGKVCFGQGCGKPDLWEKTLRGNIASPNYSVEAFAERWDDLWKRIDSKPQAMAA